MYFDTNESKSHLKAKEKLFDLIVSKRIEILDQYGNKYKIFTGESQDEFLHIESFIMDYEPNVLFSSKESPCKKHLEEHKKKAYCDMKGHMGAFKELPCQLCISNNFRKYVNGSSQFASYRPDIAFGYTGLHKIWIEIKNESPCSKNKIDFCKEKGIVLLEIDAMSVNNYKEYNGILVFNRLEEYIHIQNVYQDIEIIISMVSEGLKNNSYIYYTDILNSLMELHNFKQFNGRNLYLFKKKLEENYIIFKVENKITKNHFGLKKKMTIIITKDEYEIIKCKLLDNDIKQKSTSKSVKDTKKPVKRFCFKCKEKGCIEEMVRIDADSHGKHINKYFHKECL